MTFAAYLYTVAFVDKGNFRTSTHCTLTQVIEYLSEFSPEKYGCIEFEGALIEVEWDSISELEAKIREKARELQWPEAVLLKEG